jgi:hypothetical protein
VRSCLLVFLLAVAIVAGALWWFSQEGNRTVPITLPPWSGLPDIWDPERRPPVADEGSSGEPAEEAPERDTERPSTDSVEPEELPLPEPPGPARPERERVPSVDAGPSPAERAPD